MWTIEYKLLPNESKTQHYNMLIFLTQFWSCRKCLLALANSTFSCQIVRAFFDSKFWSKRWWHVGMTTFGIISSARAILWLEVVNLTSGFKNSSPPSTPTPPLPLPIVRLPIVGPVSTNFTRYKVWNRKSLAMWLNSVCLFLDWTYEILLNGGTPFDTGVDLDPSISLKGN